ncbi:MAG: hypothetical protein WBA44_13345 [Mesorhizobium sp.]
MADNAISAFARILGETQWAEPERLTQLQDRLIERLVGHAATRTDAYPSRLKPVLDRSGQFDRRRWTEIEVMDRTSLQRDRSAFVAKSVPPGAGVIFDTSTSGSTGRSMEFPTNSALVNVSAAAVERLHDWVGADRDASYVTISVPQGSDPFPIEGAMRSQWSWMGGEGLHGVMSIEATLSAQLDFLDRVRPAYLRTYPTNAAALAKAGQGRPWAQAIRHVIVIGETVEPDQVETIRNAVGAGTSAFYGTAEAGHLASQCPVSGDYHISSELGLVEVLREDGTPCGPGEAGRVVVTPFYAYAMPLIRYDQGDIAEAGAGPCRCGRNLPTIRRILGRSRDMFVLPNGERIWPRLSDSLMLKHLPAVQRQIVQHAPDRIELRYVHDGSDRTADEAALRALFKEKYAPEIELAVTRCDEIPRTAGGKYREFICLAE